jgi:hypothetical protein
LRKRRTGHRQHDGERKNFHAHEASPAVEYNALPSAGFATVEGWLR